MTCVVISRHASTHLRHCSAHSVMWASLGNFSHSVAQSSHAFAQASQITSASGPWRADSRAATPQIPAQSLQSCMQAACSLCPLVTRCEQCW